MKGSVRTASEDEYGRSGLFSWIVRVIMQPQSKELFTTYGEVSESFIFWVVDPRIRLTSTSKFDFCSMWYMAGKRRTMNNTLSMRGQ